MILPNILADISVVAAKCGEKPERFIIGIVKTPVAATFPGPVPDSEAIKVLAINATYPAPPGNLPISANMIRMIRLTASVASKRTATTRNAKIM